MLIPRELFRKYVAYAKQRIHPKISKEAAEEIQNFYVDRRNRPVSSESALRPIPISARQLQALIRMAEASAKLRLSQMVSREDAKKSIELMKYYLMQVGYDYESNVFDIDKIYTGMTTSKRSKVLVVREAIFRLRERLGDLIPTEEIEKELDGKLGKEEIEDSIKELIKNSVIYEPRRGYVQKI